MTYAVTNIGGNGNITGATLAITVPAAGVPRNSVILVAVSEQTATVFGTMADTAGNTYTVATQLNYTGGASTTGAGGMFISSTGTALVSGNTITYTKATT